MILKSSFCKKYYEKFQWPLEIFNQRYAPSEKYILTNSNYFLTNVYIIFQHTVTSVKINYQK